MSGRCGSSQRLEEQHASTATSPSALSSLRLHVRYDEGEGPVFVLLHGINSDATDWRVVIDRMGPGYRCIAVDLLGFGESPKPLEIEYSADDHAAVLDATLADLGITGRFALVGYSLGGDIAVRYASTFPHRLRRLFLLSTPFYLPTDQMSRGRLGPEYLQEIAFQAMWSLVARQKTDEGAIYELASGRLEDFAKGFLRTDDVSQHWDVMSKNLTNTIAATTMIDDLPALTMPVVFALGVRDPIVRPDQTPALKRLKPDIDVRRIVGLTADHFMLMNIPEKVAEEILRDEAFELNVAWRGGSGEPVVLLHGLGNDARRWQPLAQALALGSEVVAIDLLGFGESPVPLSSHYAVEDQAAAVLATVRRLFGKKRVRLIGHGLGANVALECAAEKPSAVTNVVAMSPLLIPPGLSMEDFASDPDVARTLASREAILERARDERSLALASERVERNAVPLLRSLRAISQADAEGLLNRVTVPVRFIVPAGDTLVDRPWLQSWVERHDQFELSEPNGDRDLPFERPVEALSALGSPTEAELQVASVGRSVPALRRDPFTVMLGGLNAQVIRRGTLFLIAGVPLLLLPFRIPPRLLVVGLAVWLFVEAVHTIIGAVGLRRSGKSWLPWLLIGLVSVVFGAVLLANDSFGLQITELLLVAWLLVRGTTNLFVAWRLRDSSSFSWALVLEGVLAVAIGVLAFFVPQLAGRLLRYTLGAYLTAEGLIYLASAWTSHRATKARVRQLVGGATGGAAG